MMCLSPSPWPVFLETYPAGAKVFLDAVAKVGYRNRGRTTIGTHLSCPGTSWPGAQEWTG